MSELSIQRLRKAFGSFRALNGIDLKVSDGEFVALVGPSGCGKSTLLRLVAGLEEVDEGEIRIGGRVVNDLSPRERNVAMVFQSYALYPHMTVAENMSFNLRVARLGRSEIAEKVMAAAKMLELESLLDRRPEQLSGGQRQRVAMGRALVRDPDIFLFDEPLSNLDAKLRGQMRSEIKAFHQKIGTTCLYVTHDQIEAMTLADRVVVLEAGNIRQQGKPLELYLQPDNRFVAGFIGSPPMNFLEGAIERDGDGWRAQVGNGMVLALGRRDGLAEGQAVMLGIRPEHIMPGSAEGGLLGKVLFVEPTGAQTHLTLDMGGQHLVASVDISVSATPGAMFPLKVSPGSVFLFDQATGQRVT
jgi:multiple sugar transport system ATP-binding protein